MALTHDWGTFIVTMTVTLPLHKDLFPLSMDHSSVLFILLWKIDSSLLPCWPLAALLYSWQYLLYL